MEIPGHFSAKINILVVENEARQVRAIFERFVILRSATKLAQELRQQGVLSKTGVQIDKGYLYRLLANRTYLGDAPHKGKIHPGEHEAIVSQELWDRAHAVLQVSPRVRANQARAQSPALLKGLIFGLDGRALSPTHTRKGGKQYRYYVAQVVLKDQGMPNPDIVRRIAAAEIEKVVLAQVRALVRQPEVIAGTWRAAREEAPDVTEDEVREALEHLEPMWEELFPAEQARLVQLLVERVTVGPTGADIKLRVDGLSSLVRDLRGSTAMREAA